MENPKLKKHKISKVLLYAIVLRLYRISCSCYHVQAESLKESVSVPRNSSRKQHLKEFTPAYNYKPGLSGRHIERVRIRVYTTAFTGSTQTGSWFSRSGAARFTSESLLVQKSHHQCREEERGSRKTN